MTKAPLSVGAQDAERNEGAPNPTLNLLTQDLSLVIIKIKLIILHQYPPMPMKIQNLALTISLSGGSDDNSDESH